MNINFNDNRLKELFWLGDQIPGGFFIYRADDSQELLYVNRAALGIFGCANRNEFKELTGFTFRGLVHPEDYESIQSSIDRQICSDISNKLDYVEYRVIRRDGEVRWVDDYGHFAHMPGYGDVYYVFIVDVTEKHLAQEEKIRAEVALARERQHNEIKTGFLFNMSHDIRTPMNAILGFTELARRHINDPRQLQGYLDKTTNSGQLMLKLLDDMLEMNALEGGTVHLHKEATLLREQIDKTIDLFSMEAEKKMIRLEKDIRFPEVLVWIDQNRFCRIIGNLISNAIKFTHPGGTVIIRAEKQEACNEGPTNFTFQFIDNGIGIDPDFLHRVFDAFEREGSSTVTGETGTGLGLAIVKSLVGLMDGTVRAESVKGEGSTFTVRLPLSIVQPDPSSPETAADPAAGTLTETPAVPHPHRILIAEDIELNRELVETLLEEYGFLTESVENGRDALNAVLNHPARYYDAILMDIQMPVIDGFTATRAIRAISREDIPDLPIIALSANSRKEDKEMSLESGMNAHIAKPFDIDHLVSILNRYIEERN